MQQPDGNRPPLHRRNPVDFAPGEQLPIWFACDVLLDHRALIAREEWVWCTTCETRLRYDEVVDRRTGEVDARAPAYL